ncbi:MAG TPA: LysR substrate-binding domain-containing protein [Rhizobiaceae bacterium]|nr:LysR substrate-binding domain-containing protein [Rhizobiaceae bacterium]
MSLKVSQLPSLTALRAFVTVGDVLSVRQAAEILHVDHASISRHLRGLEESVGAQLFERNVRSLALTPLGNTYHRKVKQAFDVLCDATSAIIEAQPRVLTLHATPGLAHEMLLQSIPKLADALTTWKINLLTSMDGLIRPAPPGEVHVHLRYGAIDDLNPGYIQHKIYEPRLFPVASPALLERYPPITTVDQMLSLPFLCSDTTGLWEEWAIRAGAGRAVQMSGIEMPNTHLALQAATLGHGIALGNSLLAKNAIARGELVELLETDITISAYYLVCPSYYWERTPIVELRQWLANELEEADR